MTGSTTKRARNGTEPGADTGIDAGREDEFTAFVVEHECRLRRDLSSTQAELLTRTPI
jgi:hypothetical protein